jgi:hypothetical protein
MVIKTKLNKKKGDKLGKIHNTNPVKDAVFIRFFILLSLSKSIKNEIERGRKTRDHTGPPTL